MFLLYAALIQAFVAGLVLLLDVDRVFRALFVLLKVVWVLVSNNCNFYLLGRSSACLRKESKKLQQAMFGCGIPCKKPKAHGCGDQTLGYAGVKPFDTGCRLNCSEDVWLPAERIGGCLNVPPLDRGSALDLVVNWPPPSKVIREAKPYLCGSKG